MRRRPRRVPGAARTSRWALLAGAEARFRKLDADGDGKVTRAEFSAGYADRLFGIYNRQPDGAITKAEWDAVERANSNQAEGAFRALLQFCYVKVPGRREGPFDWLPKGEELAWVVTDSRRVNAQMRFLDGSPWHHLSSRWCPPPDRSWRMNSWPKSNASASA